MALTYGDPAGIGPEILAAAIATGLGGAEAIVYGDARILRRGAEHAGVQLPDGVTVVSVPNLGDLPAPGSVTRQTGIHAMAVLERIGADLLGGRLAGVVTGPIHKEVIQLERPGFIGHTEFFAELAGVRRFGMLLVVEPFRALHVTTHMALRDVAASLSVERVYETIALAKLALEQFGESGRAIGVCGLNPHAGEAGAFGDEEGRILAPAIAMAQERGLSVVGPLSPDTAFVRAQRGEFGVVVCMYHDQGHVPLKLIGFDRGVNVTVGLPFVRTSVDHGTALDIAGTGAADSGSLLAAWALAVRLVAQRPS